MKQYMNYYKQMKTGIAMIALIVLAAGFQRCSVEPEYYSQVAPSTFFDSQTKVYQRFSRPFTHWASNMGSVPLGSMTAMQTITTDEILMPNRNGDWYDDGFYLNAFFHNFSPGTETYANYAWDAYSMGIAQAWSALEDIDAYVDFEALKFPAGTREAMLNQLKVLVAFYYWFALDHFGGVPIYTSNQGEAVARSTDVETFDFTEKLLKEALPTLPKRASGEAQDGKITQGVAASILARLYFGAEKYINKNMYAECAQVCNDIINGTYGSYAPAARFQDIFGFRNETCNELIWVVPSDPSGRQVEAGRRAYGTHYGTWAYLDNAAAMSWNGLCLVPSLDINGKSYKWGAPNPARVQYKLGSPYAKFEDSDLRKKNYLYLGGGEYEGMFLHGKLINPLTGSACTADGSREYPQGDTIAMVDQIAQIAPDENPSRPRYPDGRKEGAMYAEENSGVRLLKFSPMPNAADNSLRYVPDVPVIRLTEIIYTLAECKYRSGDKPGAALLINNIRKRYFTGGADPNPVPTEFDEYRLLDEWLIEFIGESRRRMDLIRWNKFTNDAWWDHPADGPSKAYYYRLPIPEPAINANNKLEQNQGYKI